ncbi:hypothetical protein Y09_3018 [Brachybacterium sp. SW0106-09]|uniref:hypothetical protein n=1 Tax=Brachybacterium sp. SW0106-09 TaxID=1704590 RepID=UPI0006B583D6|nr:hypothetical protein [Brachybacterium sp. SW0106-09]GAP80160.1 hypothetical protein Y09_3018 [Brachybacterium sp. SW0106-09]
MRFTQDMTSAFGEWLECDRIRHALIAERPDIAARTTLHPQRPMLRIHRPGGDVVVAKAEVDGSAAWIVGVAAFPDPVLHDASSAESATALVLTLLGHS